MNLQGNYYNIAANNCQQVTRNVAERISQETHGLYAGALMLESLDRVPQAMKTEWAQRGVMVKHKSTFRREMREAGEEGDAGKQSQGTAEA